MKKTLLAVMAAATGAVIAVPVLAAAPAMTPAMPAARVDVLFWMLDRNNDGYIDKSEVQALRTATFAALDTNGDGMLSRQEAQAGLPPVPSAANSDADRSARIAKRDDRMLMRIGFKDGVTDVTKADYVGRPMPLFDRADTDHDGRISKAEFEAAAAKFRPFMLVR